LVSSRIRVGCRAAIKAESSKASNRKQRPRSVSDVPFSVIRRSGAFSGAFGADTMRPQKIRPRQNGLRLMFVPQPGVGLWGEAGAVMAKHRASEEGFMSRPIPFLRVDKPLMVFGGPYSNLEATRAVAAIAVCRSLGRSTANYGITRG